jgi:hypothetical protein
MAGALVYRKHESIRNTGRLRRYRNMKSKTVMILAMVFALVFASATAFAAEATFDSGSTGEDGAFSPTESVVLDLPPDGVFNFTTVNIPTGVVVSFNRNANNTGAYILAQGDVTINGVITVSGKNAVVLAPGQGGPGGFDGGYGGSNGTAGSSGLGTGGGDGGCYRCINTSYGTRWRSGGGKQGIYNILGEKMVTMIGGSGGGGGGANGGNIGGGGGGGGGALLIASSGTITVNGDIRAYGGNGANGTYNDYYWGTGGGGGGSGGAIKLMATTIKGNGDIIAAGGGHGCSYECGQSGGAGKIRLEALNFLRTAVTTPGYSLGYPGEVFNESIPKLRIVSVGGVDAPDVTAGSFRKADIVIPRTVSNPVDIVVSGTNVPPDSTVTVMAVPEVGNRVSAEATFEGTLESSSATASMSISRVYSSVITATVTFNLELAMNPIYFNGEQLASVRLTSTFGKGTLVTYITKGGTEIDAGYL